MATCVTKPLAATMLQLGSCPHRLHLQCYAVLGGNLRCSACRAAVATNVTDRRALRQHSDAVKVDVLALAQRTMPTEGGPGGSTKATRGGTGWRAVGSIFHGVVEETAFVRVSCPSDAHRRYALGFAEDTILHAMANGARQVTPPHSFCVRGFARWIRTPFFNMFAVSAGRWVRRKSET